MICNNKIKLFEFKLIPSPKPYLYDELCETPQADSFGISAEKIEDVRALLRYLSPGGKKYYEDIVTSRDSTATSNKQIKKSIKGSRQNYSECGFIDAGYRQIYRSIG